MSIIWDNLYAIATRIEDTSNYIITQNGRQFIATEEEIEAEQQRFVDMYDWEEGYGYGAELDTEESEDYIEGCKRMIK